MTDQDNFPAHASQGSLKKRALRDAEFLTNVDWVMLGKQVIYVGHCRNHILRGHHLWMAPKRISSNPRQHYLVWRATDN